MTTHTLEEGLEADWPSTSIWVFMARLWDTATRVHKQAPLTFTMDSTGLDGFI